MNQRESSHKDPIVMELSMDGSYIALEQEHLESVNNSHRNIGEQ